MDVIYRYDTYKKIVPRQLDNPAEAIQALEEGHSRHGTSSRRSAAS